MSSRLKSGPHRSALPFAFLLCAAAVAAQEDGFQSNGLFSLPRSQDDIFEWRTARDEIRQGRFTEAVERLHALLSSRRHGVVPVQEGVDRWLGQRMAVIETLRELPPEGAAAYDRLTAREAGSLVRSAFESNDVGELTALAHGFPTSDAGRRARIRLGALALERGDVDQAVRHWLAARDATSAQHPEYERTVHRLQLARALLEGDRARGALGEVDADAVQAARASLPQLDASRAWIDHYGWPRRTFDPPLGEPRLHAQHAVEAYGYDANDFAVHPVGGIFGIYVCDGERVLAFDPFSRMPLWEAEGPFIREGENRNEYSGRFNMGTVLAPAVSDDVVVAPMLVPSEEENARVRAFDVIVKIPVRRLVAFDRTTGKQIWTHYDKKDGPITRRFAGHLACGPPLIAGDTVYVASHDQTGAIAFYLAAYDLHTGEPRWRRLICSSQGEVNMFGNARFEFAAAPLAIEGGVVYGTTNLGVCFAADQADGNLRWVTAYEVTQMPPTRLTHQEERPVFFANNPVVIADGVMACTPLDSEYVLGLDCATGRLLWRQHYLARVGDDSSHIQWLLGAIGDEFIVSGSSVHAIKARGGRASLHASIRLVRSRESLGVDPIIDQLPRGAIVSDKIYYPRTTGIAVFDKHGTAAPNAPAMLRQQPGGNLLVADGLLVAARRRAIDVCYDLNLLAQRAEQASRADPDDPMAALLYAQILRAQAGENVEGGVADRALEVLGRGLEGARRKGLTAESPVHRQLAGQLFDLTLQRADSLGRRDRGRAVAQLRAARDGAPDDDRWLQAQRKILQLLPPAEQIAELDLVEHRLGDKVVRFEPGREMPAAAYAMWQTAEREPTAEKALVRWQRLLEHWPDVALDGVPARDVADAMIARLIARHGRTVYAPVEARAAQALAAATGDSRALADVIERFPHSDAAGEAVRSLMDLAVAQGDLEAAARCYRAGRDREHVGPGLQRRLLEAARKRGNLPFAAALAARLRERHGSVVSDLPADGGRTYADAVAIELPPPPPPPPPVVAPTHRTLDLLPLVPGNRLQCVPVRPVAGFTAPASLPLCVLEGGTVLRAHLLEGEDPAAPAWTLDAPRLNAHAPLLACGELLLVVEQDRVRAVQLADGRVLWTRNAPDDRSFYGLGVHTGLLQVFSEHPAASDGGRLLGIEPLTGTIVHERVFSVHEASLSPVAAGGSLWSLRPEPDDRSRVWLEEIDPLSGATLHRVALDDQARELLGLDGHPTVHAALVRILSRLFVHDDLVVLAGDGASENPQRPPAIVALQRDGSVRWSWRGTPRRALVYLWHRGDVLALYEAGMQLGGQMWFLDLRNRGRELHRIGELQGSVHALTPQRGMHQDQQGPPALVLAAHSRSGWSLVCQALGGDKPRFRARLTGDGELGNPVAHPVFGADFVLVAVNMIGRDESFLHLFDIASAREQRLRLSGVQVSRVTAAGASVALETADGITILGNRGTPLR